MSAEKTKPTTDDQKTFMLSVALGAIADVRQSEKRLSKRERLMMQCEDLVCDRIDIYRPFGWSPVMMAKADKLMDRINEMIAEEFR